ncbi:helix-turn-helix transcriptional regulator [Streptomyces sp. TS71-3]|uniref:helix-turn-helix domain-containing protein n=1 Tax=Streptomyces sp. TS71-3 TaxID=2733862 RepID=UPI001B0077CD|nr:helix-turn-helix transcriptional regulator [Streptomyces sp. TS71-3]GHJ36672.1 hypothetical protein Sm713_22810 [Streptomyces sp. TS71-3]
MDPAHPLWRSSAMQDAVARHDPGAIVRLVRRAENLTLNDLGVTVGYTAASLSRMGRGLQPMRDMELLQRLAAHLGIPPHWLGLAPRQPASASAYAPPGPVSGNPIHFVRAALGSRAVAVGAASRVRRELGSGVVPGV